MRTIKFPKMFNTNSTNVWKTEEYKNATLQSTTLLLQCERGELFGDPYFGIMLKHYLFNQNNFILRDQLIDVIYNQLAIFIPQLKVNRNDIDIIQDREWGKVYCTFSALSQIDYTPNMYNIVLLNDIENIK